MFIRAVRDLQDAGSLRAVSLAEIKELMAGMDTQELLHLQKNADSEKAIRALFRDPDWDTRGFAVSVEEVAREDSEYRSRASRTKTIAKNASTSSRPSSAKSRQDMSASSIQQLIQQIEAAAKQSEEKDSTSETAVTQLSVAKMSAHISITVKGLGDDQGDLLVELIECCESCRRRSRTAINEPSLVMTRCDAWPVPVLTEHDGCVVFSMQMPARQTIPSVDSKTC